MSKAVMDAALARLGATWTSTDGTALAVLDLNAAGEPPASGSPFIAVELPVANERQLTLGSPGSNQWKEEGAIRIVVNDQRGAGIARIEGWVDELRALFRGQYLSNIQFFEANAGVINDSNDLGNYFQMSFTVRFWAFVTG